MRIQRGRNSEKVCQQILKPLKSVKKRDWQVSRHKHLPNGIEKKKVSRRIGSGSFRKTKASWGLLPEWSSARLFYFNTVLCNKWGRIEQLQLVGGGAVDVCWDGTYTICWSSIHTHSPTWFSFKSSTGAWRPHPWRMFNFCNYRIYVHQCIRAPESG